MDAEIPTCDEADIDDRYLIMPLLRGAEVLSCIARSTEPLRLKDIATSLDLSKATVFRYLRTFEHIGILTCADERYFHLNVEKAEPFVRALALERLRLASRPFMEKLFERHGCTVNLGVLRDRHIVYVDMVGAPRALRMRARIAGQDPVHTTAIGKAILANLPATERDAALPVVLRRRTEASIRNRDLLLSELEEVRAQGFAEDRGENEDGAMCIGAAIAGSALREIAAISLSGPYSSDPKWHGVAVEAIISAAQEITEKLSKV